jgi:hypothetical protein
MRGTSMRLPERVGDAGKPGVVSGGAPVLPLFAQIRQDGRVCGFGREIDNLFRIGGEIVEFFGHTMYESLQRAFPELGTGSANDRLPRWRKLYLARHWDGKRGFEVEEKNGRFPCSRIHCPERWAIRATSRIPGISGANQAS